MTTLKMHIPATLRRLVSNDLTTPADDRDPSTAPGATSTPLPPTVIPSSPVAEDDDARKQFSASPPPLSVYEKYDGPEEQSNNNYTPGGLSPSGYGAHVPPKRTYTLSGSASTPNLHAASQSQAPEIKIRQPTMGLRYGDTASSSDQPYSNNHMHMPSRSTMRSAMGRDYGHLGIDMPENRGLDIERNKSPTPSMAAEAPPQNFADLAVLYQTVAERRSAFDQLLWQVPATSLTGHAFLFSISLAPDTSRFARIASMAISIGITMLTLHLFTRQLQAESADDAWLAEFEERHQIDYLDRCHGARWKEFRNKKPPGAGRLGWLALHRSYPLWSRGFLSLGALAVAVIVISITNQNVILGFNCQPIGN